MEYTSNEEFSQFLSRAYSDFEFDDNKEKFFEMIKSSDEETSISSLSSPTLHSSKRKFEFEYDDENSKRRKIDEISSFSFLPSLDEATCNSPSSSSLTYSSSSNESYTNYPLDNQEINFNNNNIIINTIFDQLFSYDQLNNMLHEEEEEEENEEEREEEIRENNYQQHPLFINNFINNNYQNNYENNENNEKSFYIDNEVNNSLKNIKMRIETRLSKSKKFEESKDDLSQVGKIKRIVLDFSEEIPFLLNHFDNLSISLRRKTLNEMGRFHANMGEAEAFFCLHPDCCRIIKHQKNKSENGKGKNGLEPSKYSCKHNERWQKKEFLLEDILRSNQSSNFSFYIKPEWKGKGFKSSWVKPVYVFEIALVNSNNAAKCLYYSFDIELQPHKFESKKNKNLSFSF